MADACRAAPVWVLSGGFFPGRLLAAGGVSFRGTLMRMLGRFVEASLLAQADNFLASLMVRGRHCFERRDAARLSFNETGCGRFALDNCKQQLTRLTSDVQALARARYELAQVELQAQGRRCGDCPWGR